MSMSIAKSFTGVGDGGAIGVRAGDSLAYVLSGTFSATLLLQRSDDGGISYQTILSLTAGASGNLVVEYSKHDPNIVPLFKWRCDAFTSGTAVTSIAKNTKVLKQYVSDDTGVIPFQVNDDGVPVLVRLAQKYNQCSGAKAGATAGFSVNPGDNKGILASCPASKTAATLVVPLSDLKAGWTIQGFYLNGNIISAGGAVTIDAALRTLTPNIAGATDAAVSGGAITQVSKSAGYLLLPADGKTGIGQVVTDGVTYYLLITVSTAASTSVEIDNITLLIDEA